MQEIRDQIVAEFEVGEDEAQFEHPQVFRALPERFELVILPNDDPQMLDIRA